MGKKVGVVCCGRQAVIPGGRFYTLAEAGSIECTCRA